MLYSFADCELDAERAVLRRSGTSLNLQRRVFEVLLYLLEHRGHVVSKDELADQVWRVAITNTTIDACIREVRRAVGDSGQGQRIIATRHGFGYELVTPVVVRPQAAADPAELPGAAMPVPSPTPAVVLQVREAALPAVAPPQGRMVPSVHPGEKKVATILCCGVDLMPGPAAEVDLDGLHSQMRALYHLIQHEVSRYGGTLQILTDNCFLAVFGAPVAQEDHAQRAMLAALDVHHRLGTAQIPGVGAVRLGLHTGDVAVGGFADDQIIAAAVAGETARLATALQEAAAGGTILCSAATARLTQGAVEIELARSVALAGQSTAVEVYRVVPRAASQAAAVSRQRRPWRRFVGRQQELATLRRRLQQVEAGHGQVVGLVGEPGIGKSRLLYEFRQWLQQRPVTYLEGRCLSYSQETPYRPILEMLRQACGVDEFDPADRIARQVTRYVQELGMGPDDSAPYLLHLLGVPAGTERLPALPPEELKARIYATFWRLLRHVSQQQPLVMAIEDLHWIDATSDAVLTSVVEHLAGAPVLLVGTYRAGYHPSWLAKTYATQLALQPLTFRESQRLLQAVFSTTEVSESLVQRLIEQADGNPFFLEELAWTVMEHGASSPSVAVPDTVQAVLMARIDRLPPAEKHLLQVAAVIGKDVPLALLEAVAELPATGVHQGLDRLQGAEFLYESRLAADPIYTFKHALTQEVAYHSLLRSTRQSYHQRIAQALAERFPETAALYPELLAHHYTEAGLGAQSIPYWQQAGQRALERSANHEAVRHFTKGLELLKSLPVTPERVQQELELQLALGSVLLMLKGHTASEVEHAYSRAYELAQELGETPQRFAVLVGLWRFYFSQVQLQRARGLAEQCFALARSFQAPVSLQEAHLILGSTFFFMGDPVAARTHLEQAIALYKPQQSRTLAFSRGTDPGIVSLSRLAWTLQWLGYPDRARARSHEAITLAQGLSHPYSQSFAIHYNAILHVWCREMDLAKEQLEGSISFMQEHGFVHFLGQALTKLGWVLIEQGDIAEGIAKLRQGQEALQIHEIVLGRSTDLAIRAQVAGRIEHAKEGLRVLDQAFAIAHNNERFYEAELYRIKGELLLQSDAEEAEVCFRRAISLARHQYAKSLELRAVISLSHLWQYQGKQSAARQLLAEIYDWFTEGFDTPDLQEAKTLLEAL